MPKYEDHRAPKRLRVGPIEDAHDMVYPAQLVNAAARMVCPSALLFGGADSTTAIIEHGRPFPPGALSQRPTSSRTPSTELDSVCTVSPVPVTINHRYFPHIIDNIWSHLDYAGLCAASTASREWNKRARPFVLKHISLAPYGDYGLALRSRNLRYQDTALLHMESGGLLNPHQLFRTHQSPLWEWRDSLCRATLDLRQYDDLAPQHQVWLRTVGWATACLRLHDVSAIPIYSRRTTVIFCDLGKLPAGVSFTSGMDFYRPPSPDIIVNISCSSPGPHYAGTVGYAPWWSFQMPINRHRTLFSWVGGTRPKRITLVLTPGRDMGLSLAVLDFAVDCLSFRNRRERRGIKVTVVGLEQFVRGAGVQKAFLSHLLYRAEYEGPYSYEWRWKHGPGRWKRYTVEEYRKHVGEDQFLLHTAR